MFFESMLLMTMITKIVKLFIVTDPIGNLPVITLIMKKMDPEDRKPYIVKELLISLVGMLIVVLFGEVLVSQVFSLPDYSLYISGGLVLGMIGYKIIFEGSDLTPPNSNTDAGEKRHPFIFPVAIPLTLGPGAIISLIVFTKEIGVIMGLILVLISWTITAVITSTSLFAAKKINSNKGLIRGLEFIIGFLIVMTSVGMIFEGINIFNAV
ncbi:MAG: MarC family protein [Chlamydiia bacterium]|nr:MarC family protein [Chlamydiia bacterium]